MKDGTLLASPGLPGESAAMLRRPPRLALLFLGLLTFALPVQAATCPAMPADAQPLPLFRDALRDGQPATIVALGSSSTQGAGASGEAASYPSRLQAALRALFPTAPLRVVNRGVGGEDAAEMLARLDVDVLAERPALVVWQVGGNGALRGLDPERFRELVRAGIRRIRAAGADVLLMDNQRAPRIAAAPAAPRFEAALAEVAAEERVGLFRRGWLMDRWAAAGVPPAALLIEDGLHHNDRGYACLADALAGTLAASAGRAPRAGAVDHAAR